MIQKAFQGANISLGISHADISGLMPVWPMSKSGSSNSAVAAAVTQASTGKDVFFG